jgi:hypothetical protein
VPEEFIARHPGSDFFLSQPHCPPASQPEDLSASFGTSALSIFDLRWDQTEFRVFFCMGIGIPN